MIPQILNTRIKPSFFSNVVKTENGQLFMKYGQAYFPLRSIQKQQVSQKTKTLLHSYPCWLMKESLVNSNEFKKIAKYIISADPKEVFIFEQKQKLIKFHNQSDKLLRCISTIKFTYLKVLHIMLTCESNFEQISWIDAPVLEQLYISTQGAFNSIKPLQKSNFNNLLIVNFRSMGITDNTQPKMWSIMDFHRTKFFNSKRSDPQKYKIYIPPGTISICRMDLSNINFLAKLQLQRLTNFHIPHLQLLPNQHHHFTPNANYPWCPQLQFSQSKIYKSLNNKFGNKTVALSIIDYVFGNGYQQEMEIQNRMGRENNNINQNPQNQLMQDDYEEIDSDLDGPIGVQDEQMDIQ